MLESQGRQECVVYLEGSPALGEACITSGTIIVVLVLVVTGTLEVVNVSDALQSVNVARGAANAIFGLIQQCEKECNEDSKDLTEPASSEEKGATVSLKDVTFAFPSNSEPNIFTKFNLEVS